MKPHLAVLDPGTKVPELASFNRMVGASPLRMTYHLPATQGLDSLYRVEDSVVGVIILGSGASVNEPSDWQDALRAWLRPRLHTLPMLGICFGHQLLAQMLGGEVGFLFDDRHKLTGLREIELAKNPLWNEPQRGKVVVSHREAVLTLPPDCELLGRTDAVEVEAFRHRSLPLWGIQSHPEATAAFAKNNDVPVPDEDRIYTFGHGLVDAFTAWVGSRQGQEPTPLR